MLFKFMESGKEADGVMAFCSYKVQKEQDIRFRFTVIAGWLEQSVTEKNIYQGRCHIPRRHLDPGNATGFHGNPSYDGRKVGYGYV